ncbi:MAG: hypothetical protein R3D98_00955 [Candidatus Krumholzibacteriia bacterium]
MTGIRVGCALLAVALAGCTGEKAAPLPEGMVTLATAAAELNAAKGPDAVRLIGRVPDAASAFRDDLGLAVGGSPRLWPLPSAASSGYEPQLVLADVTGDGVPEAIVTAASGGSGGLVNAAVVMIAAHGEQWRFRNLFDSETGPLPDLAGGFVAGAKAELQIRAPGHAPRHETLDLAGRYAELGAEAPFAADGTLRRPVQLWGGAVMAVAPVVLAGGRPALQLVQQVRGVSNADRLATVTTDLVWEHGDWTTATVTVEALEPVAGGS